MTVHYLQEEGGPACGAQPGEEFRLYLSPYPELVDCSTCLAHIEGGT